MLTTLRKIFPIEPTETFNQGHLCNVEDIYGLVMRLIGFIQNCVLKVVSNEKEGGSRRWQMIGIGLRPRRSRFVCLIMLLLSLIFIYFRFRPSKEK